MRRSLQTILCAFGAMLAGCTTTAGAPGPTPVVSISPQPTVKATVVPGKFDSCLINPPIELLSENLSQTKADGDTVLRSIAHSPGTAVLVAQGTAPSSDRSVTFVLDELNISASGARSSTGDAWKVFQQKVTLAGIRLVPRDGDYSVCGFGMSPVSGKALAIARHAPGAGAIGTLASWNSGSAVAAATALDIFGVEPDSYVRLQLSSEPSGANILIGDMKQGPVTDTVLDVLADSIPEMSIAKNGYQPCRFGDWTGRFEPGSRRILRASCKLTKKSNQQRRH